jgi:hypothetical protein
VEFDIEVNQGTWEFVFFLQHGFCDLSLHDNEASSHDSTLYTTTALFITEEEQAAIVVA